MTIAEIRRFVSSFTISPSGCWEWTKTHRKEYGRFYLNGRYRGAHRVSYDLFIGGDKNFVLHKCDNPKCCNPHHLFTGNHADNMRDASSKKRFRQQGGRNNNAKLKEHDVVKIRTSSLTSGQLAKILGVSQQLITMIRRGELWKHVGVQSQLFAHARECADKSAA